MIVPSLYFWIDQLKPELLHLDGGRPVALPASLDEATAMTELFSVDAETTKGIYEINCRLIDPITGTIYSEDLNDFQVY